MERQRGVLLVRESIHEVAAFVRAIVGFDPKRLMNRCEGATTSRSGRGITSASIRSNKMKLMAVLDGI